MTQITLTDIGAEGAAVNWLGPFRIIVVAAKGTDAHGQTRKPLAVGKVVTHRLTKDLGGGVHVGWLGQHFRMCLCIQPIPFNRLDAAGENHPPATLIFGGAKDIVGGLDIVVEQGCIKISAGRRIGSQVNDHVDVTTEFLADR